MLVVQGISAVYLITVEGEGFDAKGYLRFDADIKGVVVASTSEDEGVEKERLWVLAGGKVFGYNCTEMSETEAEASEAESETRSEACCKQILEDLADEAVQMSEARRRRRTERRKSSGAGSEDVPKVWSAARKRGNRKKSRGTSFSSKSSSAFSSPVPSPKQQRKKKSLPAPVVSGGIGAAHPMVPFLYRPMPRAFGAATMVRSRCYNVCSLFLKVLKSPPSVSGQQRTWKIPKMTSTAEKAAGIRKHHWM